MGAALNFNVEVNEYGLRFDAIKHRESTGIIGQQKRKF
jgi:hypothetical protein